ncbi:MAG: HlyD family type I secretion periplasmic adaptor subunit [Lautropia sp.]|nr:HlyD family type I secretion periplasmic adaptor subunit [Lautropia sp.]
MSEQAEKNDRNPGLDSHTGPDTGNGAAAGTEGGTAAGGVAGVVAGATAGTGANTGAKASTAADAAAPADPGSGKDRKRTVAPTATVAGTGAPATAVATATPAGGVVAQTGGTSRALQSRDSFARPDYAGSGSDFDFMRDMQQAMVNDRQKSSLLLLVLIVCLLASAATWAYHSRLEEITRGDARVIASSREQVIQSLEGGILAEMLVREGATVDAGQPLLRIDETKARSSYQEGYSKLISLKAMAARLRAESRGTPLKFPDDVLTDAEVVDNETDTYNARRDALQQAMATSKSSQALIAREIAITKPMVAKGLVAETELLKLQRQYNDLQMQMQERTSKHRVDAAHELSKVESELAQVQESLTARQDQVTRTVLTAPVHGIVKNIRMNTRGGVIQPGQDIMEIIPLEDQLLVEAKIRPHDVAFLRPGLPATVKISAYDYAIYGGLKGEVELISPDTLRDDERRAAPGEDRYYRVLVRTQDSTLSAAGKELPIIPGMTASVEIRTGEKTVMDYVLKPILKMREAMRER